MLEPTLHLLLVPRESEFFFGSYEAWDLFALFKRDDLDITPLFFAEAFYCPRCDAVASAKTCPHDGRHHVALSGTRVRELLGRGETLPEEFTRPEVSAVLASGRATVDEKSQWKQVAWRFACATS